MVLIFPNYKGFKPTVPPQSVTCLSCFVSSLANTLISSSESWERGGPHKSACRVHQQRRWSLAQRVMHIVGRVALCFYLEVTVSSHYTSNAINNSYQGKLCDLSARKDVSRRFHRNTRSPCSHYSQVNSCREKHPGQNEA